MTIAYNSVLDREANIGSLESLRKYAEAGVDNGFTLATIRMTPRGSVDETNPVMQLTLYGDETAVDEELGEILAADEGALIKSGVTTTFDRFRGQEAGGLAVAFANYKVGALNAEEGVSAGVQKGCQDGIRALEMIAGERIFLDYANKWKIRRDDPAPIWEKLRRLFAIVDQAIEADVLSEALAGAVNNCETCAGCPVEYDGPMEGCRLGSILEALKQAKR
jgi:hypothetical protein